MMETDLFQKLCFGVKFTKYSAPPKHDGDIEVDSRDKDGKEDRTEKAPEDRAEAPDTQTEGKKKRRRKKKMGAMEQKAQEINTLKNQHRIHTDGENVPDPVGQFEELQERYSIHRQLLANIGRAGFATPTPVQMQAVPVMMEGRDIMAGAPTGSGKTAAFVIPILHQLQRPDNQGFRAVILAPTRELAKQILQVCRQLSEGIGFCCHYIDKATKAVKFGPNSKKNCDVLVSTPNRLVYMLKHDPPLIDLSRVEWLVVDESDKLFEDGETGFQDQLAVIDNACSHSGLRHAFFSATFSNDVKMFCQSTMDNLVQVNVGARNTATHLVKQELLFVGSEAGKRMAMRNLIREGITPPVLIFVQSKQRAKELYSEFMYDSIKVDVIHADKPQAERDATVRHFMEGQVWALVCTELMGRGIDFKGINLVINYDFPTNAVSYIHRIGRTGRAGVPGRAITFFTEQDVTHLRSIANIMKESGCEVPEYMLKLKKPSKKDKKKKFPVKRKRIATVLHEDVNPAKRRKLSADQHQAQATGREQPTGKKQRKQKKKKSANHSKLQVDKNNKPHTNNNNKQPSKMKKKKGQMTQKKRRIPKTM
ncbi:putative ATP-dependent RNA helicase DDX52 [Babylonia areolata]|uniref:putative ATP-dependent RNA helicase DDX52 n=1 Tax=Babylonia areolata TaxID=304850 RepID=UPI003FD12D3E